MLVLNDLRDKPKSVKKYKRVGRGKANSPGHGGKGQTARTGVALGNFQGGQTPIERRLPKHRTFYTKPKLATVSLISIERLLESGYIQENTLIDFDLLKKFKLIKKVEKFKVVGACARSLNIVSDAISKGALESLNQNKGSWKSAESIKS